MPFTEKTDQNTDSKKPISYWWVLVFYLYYLVFVFIIMIAGLIFSNNRYFRYFNSYPSDFVIFSVFVFCAVPFIVLFTRRLQEGKIGLFKFIIKIIRLFVSPISFLSTSLNLLIVLAVLYFIWAGDSQSTIIILFLSATIPFQLVFNFISSVLFLLEKQDERRKYKLLKIIPIANMFLIGVAFSLRLSLPFIISGWENLSDTNLEASDYLSIISFYDIVLVFLPVLITGPLDFLCHILYFFNEKNTG